MDTLVIDNKLYRFNTEYENTDDLTRRAQLKAISEKLKGRNLNNVEKFNQILNNIQTKQNNKPYHRLNLFQKEQIVKDYVKEKWGINKVESYAKQILKFIETKQIVTSNVVYNLETGLLENIKNIIIEDDLVCIKTKGCKSKQVERVEVEEKDVNLKTKEVNLKTKEVNLKTKEVNLKTKEVEEKPKDVNLKTKDVNLKTKDVNLKTKDVNLKNKEVESEEEKSEKSEEEKPKNKKVELKTKEVNLKNKEVGVKTKQVGVKTKQVEEKTIVTKNKKTK
jgi:hypothetical protein